MQTSKAPVALGATLAEFEVLDGQNDSHSGSSGGRSLAPQPQRRLRGLLRRAAESAWLPLLGRGAGIAGGMLLFAGIGIYSTRAHPGGVHVASQMAPGAPVSWLAPAASEETSRFSSPGNSVPSTASATPSPGSTGIARFAAPDRCAGPTELCNSDKKNEPPPGVTKDGKVILNVAGAQALTRLPGVGERRAEAIVRLRERLKRFRRATDLLRVRGIGVKSLKRMLPHLVLDPPAKQKDEGNKQAPAQKHPAN